MYNTYIINAYIYIMYCVYIYSKMIGSGCKAVNIIGATPPFQKRPPGQGLSSGDIYLYA